MAACGAVGVQVVAPMISDAKLVRLSSLLALSVKLTLTFSFLPWSAATGV